MPAKRILFVNKTIDSKSLSQSEGLEKARIFSHVRPLPASKSKIKQVAGPTSSRSSSQGSARRAREDIAEGSGTRRPTSNGDAHDDSKTVVGQSDRRLGTPARPTCCHHIPPHVSSKLDSFNCTIVPMDPFMEDIFSQCKSWLSLGQPCTLSLTPSKSVAPSSKAFAQFRHRRKRCLTVRFHTAGRMPRFSIRFFAQLRSQHLRRPTIRGTFKALSISKTALSITCSKLSIRSMRPRQGYQRCTPLLCCCILRYGRRDYPEKDSS